MKRQNPLQKATRRIETEGRKHCLCIYSATAMALYRYWGKKQKAISSLFDETRRIWIECAKDHDHSMIEMCENETGIEIQNGDGKTWKELAYLNGSLDPGRMTEAQWLYMRQQQIKWIRPQVMACLMIALHRRYGFGFERCARVYQQIQDIEAEYKANPERLRKACYEMTGIDTAKTATADRRRVR